MVNPTLLHASPARPPSGPAWLALGFRPFFLAAAVAAVVAMGLWLGFWLGWATPGGTLTPTIWHGHEMLFGYAGAVIAGFLLTAVRNWTGLPTPSGQRLAVLVSLWALARLTLWIPGVSPWLAAPFNIAFFPVLAASLAHPLWQGANRVNRWFLAILLAMGLAQTLVQLEALGLAPLARSGLGLMLNLVLLLLIFVAGRVLPFFTERAVAQARPRSRRWLEIAGLALVISLAIVELTAPGTPLVTVLTLTLAVAQAIRLAGWYHPGIWRIPILWVLYTGYLWLILGLVLKAGGGWGLIPAHLALHGLTVGGIGIFTLGMMARVTLGHTGRPMHSARAVNLAFALMNLAVLLRVAGPLVVPAGYSTWIIAAGLCWMLAFSLLLVVHGPMLWRPRVDGAPG
jgi:uncharacterized protein involved in response to NO